MSAIPATAPALLPAQQITEKISPAPPAAPAALPVLSEQSKSASPMQTAAAAPVSQDIETPPAAVQAKQALQPAPTGNGYPENQVPTELKVRKAPVMPLAQAQFRNKGDFTPARAAAIHTPNLTSATTAPTKTVPAIDTVPVIPVSMASVQQVTEKADPASPAAPAMIPLLNEQSKTAPPIQIAAAAPATQEIQPAPAQIERPVKQRAAEGTNRKNQGLPSVHAVVRPGADPAAASSPVAAARNRQTTPARFDPDQRMFVSRKPLVEVANGTGGKGVAAWWGNHLREQGVMVTQFTTAGSNYPRTKIYYSNGYLQEAYQIAKKIPLYQDFVRVDDFKESGIKVKVVIGRDVLRFTHKDARKILIARADI
jgi:hypothetical protein